MPLFALTFFPKSITATNRVMNRKYKMRTFNFKTYRHIKLHYNMLFGDSMYFSEQEENYNLQIIQYYLNV